MANEGMIEPFEPQLVRHKKDFSVISYGLGSYGYDIRLSPSEFRIFRHIPGTVVDPKNFNPHNLEPTTIHKDENGSYFILPAHSYGLGVALEKLSVPDNITVICIGYLIQEINNKQQQQRRIFFTQCNYILLHKFICTA
jgi:dCTP deaminase